MRPYAELREQFTIVRESVDEPHNPEQIVLLDLSTKALNLLSELERKTAALKRLDHAVTRFMVDSVRVVNGVLGEEIAAAALDELEAATKIARAALEGKP